MMSRRRREVRHYARMYLGVKRLPAGVPAVLDDLLKRSTLPIPAEGFASVLRRYRKMPLVL